MLQEYNCSHLLPSSLSAGTASTYCNCNMPQPAEDVIDLTNDSEHEDVMQPPAPGPRPNRAHVPRPLSTAARQQLYKAIESCPEDKLRDILANMVADDAVSTRTLFDNLVVVNPPRFPALEVQHPRLDPVPVLPVVAGQAPIAAYIPAPHRVVPRWATCAHCGEDFDAADEQEEDECVYHSGYLQVNYNEWPDHEEDVHGLMDTAENRRNYPQGFEWTCCRRDGSSRGCTEGTHTRSKKRRRDL